jgi:hypothetical protein
MRLSFLILVFVVGCTRLGAAPTLKPEWNPVTKVLDDHVKVYGESGDLARDLEKFYELLHKKQWRETYEMRSDSFRSVFSDHQYIEDAEKDGTSWELLNYEILSVELFGDNAALVICEFIEGPGRTVSYAAVCWKKQQGHWKCEEAGPSGLPIFHRMSTFECAPIGDGTKR